MKAQKNSLSVLGLVLAVSLLASGLTVLLLGRHSNRISFQMANGICGELLEREPDLESSLLAVLKEYREGKGRTGAERDVLSAWGYREGDFTDPIFGWYLCLAAAGAFGGSLVLFLTHLYRRNRVSLRIQALSAYLEQACSGKARILSADGEDDFSKLEDGIYKTVTSLYQTRDAALEAREEFAENLSNIAHQIKTPLTAMSLSLQMMEQNPCREHLEQIRKQLLRLTHLEEALLLLSRLDAGTLPLQKRQVDVFTLLVLAADNLQELFAASGTAIDIPELGETAILADLEWTMEAVMNLMKNCMEHNAGGTVHCSYRQNPLYTEILIWDEGEGFVREELPHLFERFYRGQHASQGGIGIGLSLAREILERQNGTIRAGNNPQGGASFEIRFYSH